MDLVYRAKVFATQAHEGQMRRDGITPYIIHPQSVVQLLEYANIKDQEILAAAWLHDTIEDCGITKDMIIQEFNPIVAGYVDALTRYGPTEEDRIDYKHKIKSSGMEVQLVKVADIVHNLSTMGSFMGEVSIKRKVNDCYDLYIDLAKQISPELYEKLLENLKPWEHYYNH